MAPALIRSNNFFANSRDCFVPSASALSVAQSSRAVAVHRPAPRYPEDKRLAGTSGEAVVQFRVGPNGVPQSITVAQVSDPAFAPAAEECVRQWRFLPTVRDGAPTSTLVELPVRFQAAGGTGGR